MLKNLKENSLAAHNGTEPEHVSEGGLGDLTLHETRGEWCLLRVDLRDGLLQLPQRLLLRRLRLALALVLTGPRLAAGGSRARILLAHGPCERHPGLPGEAAATLHQAQQPLLGGTTRHCASCALSPAVAVAKAAVGSKPPVPRVKGGCTPEVC